MFTTYDHNASQSKMPYWKAALATVIVCLLFIPVSIQLCLSIWEAAGNLKQYLYFAGSALVCYLLMRKFGGSRLNFAQTFTHELIHAIFTFLSGGKVYEFHAKENSGFVLTDRSDIVMTLGPYYFPIYTILLMCIRPGIRPVYLPILDIVAGVTFAFYLYMIKKQSHSWQTDIRSYPWWLSYPFITLTAMFFSYLIIAAIQTNVWAALSDLCSYAWRLVSTIL